MSTVHLVPKTARDERQHEIEGTCWCCPEPKEMWQGAEPYIIHKCPEDG